MELMLGIYNEQAEQEYLGSILYEPTLLDESVLKPEHFYYVEHQLLFTEIRAMQANNEPLDMSTVYIRVTGNGINDKIVERRGNGYVMDLAMSVASTVGFKYKESKILEAYRLRESQKFAKGIMMLNDPEEGREQVLEYLNKIQDVLDTGVADDDDGSIKGTLVQVYDLIEGGGNRGVQTQFKEFDRMTMGLHMTDLVIVGARPSMGKTAFALNIAQNVADSNPDEHVAVFSLEMSKPQLVQRMVSTFGRIDAQRMRSGALTDDDWNKLTMSMTHFGQLENLHIWDKAGVTVPEMKAKVMKLKKKVGNDKRVVVIIDYLQLINFHGNSNENQTVKIGEISKALKQMAKDLNVCVVALSQLSRGVEQRQDKRPMMSDIRESGNIEQDADVITFLYRDDYYDRESENKNIIELIIAKQRNGPVGTVQTAFIKEYGLFVNLETRYDSPQ